MKINLFMRSSLLILGLALIFSACKNDLQSELEPVKEEVTTEQQALELTPIHIDDEGYWSEIGDGMFVTPEYYETELYNATKDRYYANCPTCNVSPCSCPSGWSCINLDCWSGVIQGGISIGWHGSESIAETNYPFNHQRNATCQAWSYHSCFVDKDNRFYFPYKSSFTNFSKLRLKYSGSKSWFCGGQPQLDYLVINTHRYFRVTTGEYCPTSSVRLVRVH